MTDPTTWPLANSSGHTFEILDRPEDALHAFEGVLRVEPGREMALHSSGRVLARLRRLDLARSALQKTIAVDPWLSDYHLALARLLPGRALVGSRRGLPRGDPAQSRMVEARSLLVQCYLRSREPDKADAEFQILLRFYPASREVWQQWYEQQKQENARLTPTARPDVFPDCWPSARGPGLTASLRQRDISVSRQSQRRSW